MSQPAVTLNELDGALGTLPIGSKRCAFLGVSTAGTIALPAAFARTKDVVSNYTRGPNAEAACYWIQNYQAPAIVVRTGQSTVGTKDAIDVTGVTGTSVVTATGATLADDDVEAYFKVIVGGTIGVAGITYVWSLDNGRSVSPVTSLGTANTFVFPNVGGLGFSFAAGTLVAGDVIKQRAYAARWNTAEIGAALDALRQSTYDWDVAVIAGTIDSAAFDAIVTAFAAMPEKMWLGSTRMPNAAESEAAYKTALDAIFGSKSDTHVGICAGAARVTSAITFRSARRPFVQAAGARIASRSEEQDAAVKLDGALPGVSIYEGPNPAEHDESVNPGLDDSRFIVARTWANTGGVFINNPNLLSALGSDFQYVQHRRVMNLARRTLRMYFEDRLSRPVLVNASTGFILESEALEIEAGGDAVMRAVLRAKPKCSGGGIDGKASRFVKLSRTDNLLSTKTMNVQGAVIPLAYPKAILIDLGFRNPALQVVSVTA